MSIFKRIYTTVCANVDEMVGEIENHDALISAALADQRRNLAVARQQLSRLRTNEERALKQQSELREKESDWTRRAREAGNGDEELALTCLKRRQQERARLEVVEQKIGAYRDAIVKLESNVEDCEGQMSVLTQKQDVLRARQSGADARGAINRVSGSMIDETETALERWEVKLARTEYLVDDFQPVDRLEEEFLARENEAELRDELRDLLSEERDDEHQ